ncbi:hypothetical protein ACJIZ3_007722 [Penstemon smallii]|uniref:BHLH domain-containing protein n=1 Tax=Penstemon smallii TaxID=265156 RepID=A0ABD3T7R1_9LAMI
MYEESAACFDPRNLQEGLMQQVQSYPQNSISQEEMELQNQLNMEVEQQCYNYNNNNNEIIQNGNQAHFIQEMSNSFNNGDQNQNPSADLLNMFSLPPRCSQSSTLLPNSSITFSNTIHKSPPTLLASLGLFGDLNSPADGSSGSVLYDPLLPINLHPQPPFLRDLFNSLPNGSSYAFGVGAKNNNGSLFDERDVNGGLYQENFDNGVFEFTAGEMDCIVKNRDGKETKHFATERHRRVLLNDKYQALRKLVPNPTKNDRASIVGDAIDYINELKRTVTELKVLVEKKRCAMERLKRPKTENDSIFEGNDSKSLGDMEHPFSGSWLHRKSKNTEVDVRIIDDEVTVKLVQQKRINCLLFVSKVLDELHLDLHHVAGGLIGDYYSFLFNSKICEGSIVYASAVANKLIEVVDKEYAAIAPSRSY